METVSMQSFTYTTCRCAIAFLYKYFRLRVPLCPNHPHLCRAVCIFVNKTPGCMHHSLFQISEVWVHGSLDLRSKMNSDGSSWKNAFPPSSSDCWQMKRTRVDHDLDCALSVAPPTQLLPTLPPCMAPEDCSSDSLLTTAHIFRFHINKQAHQKAPHHSFRHNG